MKSIHRRFDGFANGVTTSVFLLSFWACICGADESHSGGSVTWVAERHRRPPVRHRIEPMPLSDHQRSLATPHVRSVNKLEPISHWALILNGVDLRSVKACKAQVIVMDATRDGSLATMFTRAEVEEMRGGSAKKLLAYMSIGEAEAFRGYLDPHEASWIGVENSEFPQDYFVEYWHQEWQDILFGRPDSYIDRILAAGFDGVFLDKVDSWELARENGRVGAEFDMMQLISRLTNYALSKTDRFLVVPNNAEPLLSIGLEPFASALLAEDILFRDQRDEVSQEVRSVEAQPPEVVQKRVAQLKRARVSTLPVLAVEYLTTRPSDQLLIPKSAEFLRQAGFVPHFSDRDSILLHCALD